LVCSSHRTGPGSRQGWPADPALPDRFRGLPFRWHGGPPSADFAIWKPASDYDRLELKAAAEKAGLLFDPKQTLDPDRPYLQLVEPGLTQLGVFDPVLIERIGRLHLFRPPIENLIAAKLIRAEPKDLGDIRFLVSRHRPDLSHVRRIIAEFHPPAHECATENLVYLEVLET
jgi:hypothetical protein